MAKWLPFWDATIETFGVIGALALLVYAGVLLAALMSMLVEVWRSMQRWRRHRAVARLLDDVHQAAYREHHGGHGDAA